MRPIERPPLGAIREAAERLEGVALRTPVVALDDDLAPEGARVFLKLENLQPIGSFKLRGAGNAMALAGPEALAEGVYTASAGNMAQGVAWNARRMGVPCRVVVPDTAPATKLEALRRLGGEALPRPFDDWWRVLVEHGDPSLPGLFIHPVADPAVIAGNGTIGLELLEQVPEVDTVLVPYGGGGLACGIAAAVQALKPGVRVLAVEVETAAPLTASLAAGRPVTVERRASFVDGIGGRGVLEPMWPLVRELIDGAVVVSVEAIVEAMRALVVRRRV
ncbi:MAG: pyridoxal-phosphate dependent enzyme, partial [Gemmatimonadetes bacterium]